MKARLCIIFLAAAALLAPAFDAHAYVLAPEQIFTLMARALGKDKSLSVTGRVVLYPEKKGEKTELAARALYSFPDSFREELGKNQVFVAGPMGAAKIKGNDLASEMEGPMDYYKDLLLIRKPGALLQKLSLRGVDVSTVSLGRYKGQVAFVIGAFAPDETVPQVWVDKETFLPMRWIVSPAPPGSSTGGLEVLYTDWKTIGSGKKTSKYPMRISVLKGGKLISERLAKDCVVNPAVTPADFTVGVLRKKAQAGQLQSDVKTPSSPEMDQVRKTIQNFRKLYGD